MELFSLQTVAKACSGRLLGGPDRLTVERVCTDSRAVRKGDLFVALKGDRFDGHEYLEKAAELGAVAVMAEDRAAARFPKNCPVVAVADSRRALADLAREHRKKFAVPVVAVCGSNGKTSTKELIAAVLREAGPVLASEASFNNDIGVPLTLLRQTGEHRFAVVEAGTNHPGELAPLLDMVRPKIGVLTSIGREHLEFFHDLEGVAEEEGAIAEALPSDGCLVVNGQTPCLGEILVRAGAPVVMVGVDGRFDFSAGNVAVSEGGTRFRVYCRRPELDGDYSVQLLGRHHVANALLAIAVGAELGLNREQIARGLAGCAPAKMRMQWDDVDGVRVLNDAYNANADSMAAALRTMAELPATGRRVAVLGDMGELGDHAGEAHAEAGRSAATAKLDWLLAVGRNAGLTVAAARKEGFRERLDAVADVDAATALLGRELKAGDLVLLKASRAMKLERVLDGLRASSGKAVVTA
jgi:UDP-N-acetylmuramoyl-tripeptide--D-alanyl-D-alanine ligase